MAEYAISDYQEGFERDQARIGRAVARDWIWPYAYDRKGLLELHARPDFDPDTRHYCFRGGEMVGYNFSVVAPPDERGLITATLDFPRVIPGHEGAASLLVERALEVLREKGVSRVVGRVTTMVPADIQLAEEMGFAISDWGYKVYYSYEMGWGRLDVATDAAQEVDPRQDLDGCAEMAARWYGRPVAWCRAHLEEWHQEGNVITHLAVREGGRILAACMAAPNDVRPSTAAIYYIYTPDGDRLRPMLAKVVNRCLDHGRHNVIADLIYEHRQYGAVYRELGFKKVAEWARCERAL
jgi:hypothetical protein